jgi:hypothetical protein
MNAPSDYSSSSDMQRFSALRPFFEGTEAIHVERPGIFHVRISQISVDAWGLKATATDMLTPGMYPFPASPDGVAMAWEVFSFNKLIWDFPNVPACRWTLYFDPVVIRALLELAAAAHHHGAMIDWKDAKAFLSTYNRTSFNEPLSNA